MSEDLIKNSLGIFVGQSRTRLVLGRMRFRIRNKYAPSCEHAQAEAWAQEQFGPEELSKLEELYKEFCEKAHKFVTMHPSMNGPNLPHKVVFPDLYYEIVPNKLP